MSLIVMALHLPMESLSPSSGKYAAFGTLPPAVQLHRAQHARPRELHKAVRDEAMKASPRIAALAARAWREARQDFNGLVYRIDRVDREDRAPGGLGNVLPQ